MIDLVRLGRSKGFSRGDQNLYRRVAARTGLVKGVHKSLVDVPCGLGAVAHFLAGAYEVDVVGVDPDPELVDIAEERARAAGLATQLHFQAAPLHDLPLQN